MLTRLWQNPLTQTGPATWWQIEGKAKIWMPQTMAVEAQHGNPLAAEDTVALLSLTLKVSRLPRLQRYLPRDLVPYARLPRTIRHTNRSCLTPSLLKYTDIPWVVS